MAGEWEDRILATAPPFFTLHVGRLIFERRSLKIAPRSQTGGPRSIYFHGTTVPDGFIEPIPRSEIEELYKCPGNRLTDVLITEQPSLSILSTEPDRYSYKVHNASIPRYSARLNKRSKLFRGVYLRYKSSRRYQRRGT